EEQSEPPAQPEPQAQPEPAPTPAAGPEPQDEPLPETAADPLLADDVLDLPTETEATETPEGEASETGVGPDTPTASPAPKPAVAATTPAPGRGISAKSSATAAGSRQATTRKWVTVRAMTPPARQPEVEHGEDQRAATVWLNRALPDPTPISKRLTSRFAAQLAAAARRHDADWSAILGVLRAQGSRGAAPATRVELDRLAARLAGQDTWRAALALSGRTGFADRAEALADYYRAVGLRPLVIGLEEAKGRVVKRLLTDERVWLYWGGRTDLEVDRIDVRIVALVSYLAERHGSVTVSSLFSGHRKFARPGVISAHTYGQAVDIAAVGGTAIAGNSQPGGMTEEAVRSILLLPSELQPQQVISLLGLGGPSFPLADHGDHIHVGY
ncbi:MAG: hypothetical protein H0V79_05550, partial [Actinobacteria bacterium]|nr:hypothetical protein [Actinomycetota bacterium]